MGKNHAWLIDPLPNVLKVIFSCIPTDPNIEFEPSPLLLDLGFTTDLTGDAQVTGTQAWVGL